MPLREIIGVRADIFFGTALSIGAVMVFLLQAIGIIPFYIFPATYNGKTFDIATAFLVVISLVFPSRGLYEVVERE